MLHRLGCAGGWQALWSVFRRVPAADNFRGFRGEGGQDGDTALSRGAVESCFGECGEFGRHGNTTNYRRIEADREGAAYLHHQRTHLKRNCVPVALEHKA